jgi:hemerythrin-like domain-containing protein
MEPETTPFQSFRDDHRNVLARLDALDGVLSERSARKAGEPLEERPIRELVSLLDAQFDTHMRDEEELLFPALAEALPEAAPTLSPLHAEHAELRQMLSAVSGLLGRESTPSRDEQIVVQLRDFVDLLRIHVHKEEAAVFKVAARVLPPPDILALSARITARRERRPDSSPRRLPR